MSDDQDVRVKDQLRSRAWGAMVTDAFWRWESAIIIALTMILFVLVRPEWEWWQQWYWLVAGALAEVAFVVAHVTDPQAAQQAVERMFSEKYDPRDIRNRVARQRMQKALEYRAEIARLVNTQSGALQVSMKQTLDEIDDWIENIYRLAKRMDLFEANNIIEQDMRRVPTELQALQSRLSVERSPVVRAELEQALAVKRQQMENLQALADNIRRADIQLDNTLAALGTVYAQMQVIDTKDVDSARARRLREEIRDEVSGLQDTILAMEDVYSNRLTAS